MKKGNWTYRILKAAAITVCTPIVILWLLIVLLYLPPLQRYAVDKVCHAAGEASGFDVSIGTFHLAFPLKLNIADFEVSRNDTIFAQGEHAGVNISFFPLLSGEVEVNYISLEKATVNTADIIDGIKIDGEVGFFRIVARNIDLEKEIVNLRQVHLHSADVNITLSDTTETIEEEESTKLGWIIKLHHGGIENCRIALNMPNDTLNASLELGKLRLREGHVNLDKELYGIEAIALSNTRIKYDTGTGNKKENPLSHLEFNNINLACKDIEYSPDSSKLDIDNFTLVQPGGIRITNTTARLFADKEKLDVREFSIYSRNGSYIDLCTKIPWAALQADNNGNLTADLAIALNRKDLGALLSPEQSGALQIFDNEMFSGTISVNGNVSYMDIDTINLSVPSILLLHASGHAANLTEMDAIEASIDMHGKTGNLHRFINPEHIDSLPSTEITVDGNIAYKLGTAGADLKINGFGGAIDTKAKYDINNNAYKADIEIAGIDVTKLLQDIPLTNITANLKVDGEGFDIFAEDTRYDICLGLDTLIYDKISLNDITLNATQHKCLSDIELSSNSEYLKFGIKANTELDSTAIRNRTRIDISEADLMMLGITDAELGTKMKLEIETSTDMQESHSVKLNGKNIEIAVQKRKFTPADIAFDFSTTPQFSSVSASNGDLNMKGTMNSGYNGLFKSLERIAGMFREAVKKENTLYYIHDYAREIPDVSLDFECGKQNMLHNFLVMKDIDFNDMNLGASISKSNGINMNSGIYGLKTGELHLDTIRLFTKQNGNNIRYLAGVRSTAVNPQQEKLTFSSMLYGNIFNDSITTNFMFRDKKEGVGIRFGLKTLVKPKELEVRFRPDAVFFNNKFSFDKYNYIKLTSNGTITGDVTLSNEENAGMRLYTTPDDEAKLNANLELFNIDLEQLTSTIPFVPEIAGMLNLDLYFKKGRDDMMLSSDIRIDSVAYNGTQIGNESIEIVYLPKDESTHYLDVLLNHNEEEVLHISGDYINDTTDPGLHGDITLTRFPLGISSAFTKDTGLGLSGYVNGELTAEGKLSGLSTDGFVQFDSVYINAPLFGTDLHLSENRVNIKDNRISFKNFNIYAKGDNPFKLNGSVDLSKLSNPAFNLRMNANDYELVNAPRTRGSMLYGKMFIDLRAFIGGTMNSMKVYGDATLLGKSNITYVMLDAPITTDKELDGLVEFVNFQDTTTVNTEEEEADLGNMNINLGLRIEEGARINADLDANRSSYVMLQGGGNLNMSYTGDNGLNLTGTYTMSEGELKYELPIIPLKTFNIIDGSKVTWNGDILDPTIEITAIERITTSVSIDDGNMQPVAFDVGVKLSNTLSDMGLTFTISAPENAVVQDQLNSLDAETLNKYAVTMLITGTYIGNSKSMTVSNALSSFLDAKINDIAGSAMKSVSVNIGINDAENTETGGTYKNYSFSLKKRFLNDRLTVVIGGEVNSGDMPTTNDSFINNISLEWKIGDSSNRYIRLFYDKNYESLLEGEIIETGIGYVYKKKLQNLRELFTFKKNRKNTKTPMSGYRPIGEKRQKEEGK